MTDPKFDGLESELAFCLAASRRGFSVSKPLGDSTKYDAILDNGPTLFRVQVKSTSAAYGNGCYDINIRHSGSSRYYTRADVDVVALHIKPIDKWFLLPVEAVENTTTITLRPEADNLSRYNIYDEAWHIFYVPNPVKKSDGVSALPDRSAANA